MRKALNLTEAFVQLAKAESEAYQFQPSMFAMLLLDTFDQASSIAHLKNIQLLHDLDEDAEALVLADQSLLTRALFNLLEKRHQVQSGGVADLGAGELCRGLATVRNRRSGPRDCCR